MKQKEETKEVKNGVEETLTYCKCPSKRRTRICTDNIFERLNQRFAVASAWLAVFPPDGNSAMMRACAQLRYVVGTQLENKKYINMNRLETTIEESPIVG